MSESRSLWFVRTKAKCPLQIRFALSLVSSLLVFSLFGFDAKASEQRTVAFLGLTAKGVSKDVSSNVTDIVATELGSLPEYKLITVEEINAMLGMEKLKDSLGCTDTSCLADIGGSLGADLVLTGSVGQLGELFTVSLSLVNIQKAETEGRGQSQANNLSQLPKAAREAVAQLTGRRVAAAGTQLAGKGSLFLNTTPKGADVFLDGRPYMVRGQSGKTPLTIDDIQAGDHVVKVQVDDLSREIPVLIKPDRINKYAVNLRVVRVKITSVPFDAEAFLDGEPRGTTPVLLPEVPAGRHQLELRKKGFRTAKLDVDVDFEEHRKTGETQVLSANLEPEPVLITCKTTPSDVTLYVDGKAKGTCPGVIRDVLPGTHDLEFEKKGYRTEKRKIQLEPAKPIVIELVLAELKAHAEFVSSTETHGTFEMVSAVTAGVLLAGSGAMTLLAMSDKKNADDADKTYQTALATSDIESAKADRKKFSDAYKQKTMIGLGLLGAGVAATGLFAFLFFTPPDEPDYSAHTEVLPVAVAPFMDPVSETIGLASRISF